MFRTSNRDIITIKGLSERRRLPRMQDGKIRLGIKKVSGGKEHPHELDYFLVPPPVARVYGPTPKTLPILFPADDPGIIFPQAYKWYGQSSGLKCKGNGEIALRCWSDVEPATQLKIGGKHQGNDLIELPCPCHRLETKDCRVIAHLMFMLPAFPAGVFQIDTSSVGSIERINSKLDWIRGLFGFISWIPLTLSREPVPMRYNDRLQTHYLLRLDYEGSPADIHRLREQRAQAAPPILYLPVPSDEGPGMNGDQPSPPPLTTPEAAPTAFSSTSALSPLEAQEPARTSTQAATAVLDNPTPSSHHCACGAKVSETVAAYSRKYFSETICMNCQKKRYGVTRKTA